MMRFWRGFFVAAGGFNVLGGLWGFVAYEDQFRRDGLPLPTYPFAFQLLFLFVVIMGLAYFLVAYDPIRNRNLVWVGLLTKIAGLAMAYWAIIDGQLPPSTWWQPLVRDLVWGIGFAAFLGTTAGRRRAKARPTTVK